MSLPIFVAFAGSALGLASVAGLSVWYWLTVVPDFYEGDTAYGFIALVGTAAVSYIAISVGALWRRRRRGLGLGAMAVANAAIGAIAWATMGGGMGAVLLPSLLVTLLALFLQEKAPAV
ncbi:MAG: hypothetical protein HY685_05245 [Chloroflexi bacterium]|nr:hypothetical protein [Chloroflexota bacterium]